MISPPNSNRNPKISPKIGLPDQGTFTNLDKHVTSEISRCRGEKRTHKIDGATKPLNFNGQRRSQEKTCDDVGQDPKRKRATMWAKISERRCGRSGASSEIWNLTSKASLRRPRSRDTEAPIFLLARRGESDSLEGAASACRLSPGSLRQNHGNSKDALSIRVSSMDGSMVSWQMEHWPTTGMADPRQGAEGNKATRPRSQQHAVAYLGCFPSSPDTAAQASTADEHKKQTVLRKAPSPRFAK